MDFLLAMANIKISDIVIIFRSDMELDLPSNFNQTILDGMETAARLWASGQKSRLTVMPVKVQSSISQLKASMFTEDKYEVFNFKTACPIGGTGFL